MPFFRDPYTGEFYEGEMEDGVRYRSLPTRETPDELHAEMVWEPMGVGMKDGVGVTNAKARVRLRQAGIHPYSKDVEQYRKQRTMTEGDKRRHGRKIADSVRKKLKLDQKIERATGHDGKGKE